MRSSFQIARFFDIPVRLHWTFFLLLAWVGYTGYLQDRGWIYISWWILLVLTVFLCVVLHEFGHALTARRYGVQTRDIILSPIGGIARLEKLPENPIHEFRVAIAGPLVNLAIAALLSPVIWLLFSREFQHLVGWATGTPPAMDGSESSLPGYFLPSIFLLNITLAVFNMLPAFPMDGGRILRALLSLRYGRTTATRIAARLGQALAILLALYGLWRIDDNFITVIIGVFVFITATQEYQFVRIESLLEEHCVGEVMRGQFTRLLANQAVETAFRELQRGGEKNFLVFDDEGDLLGVLHDRDILSLLKANVESDLIAEHLLPAPPPADPGDTLKQVFDLMQRERYRILPVQQDGQLIGVIDVHAIHHFLQLQRKLKK
ncbi:MAG: site-2 protease family protein [Saprospiraceae bacterium]|nr:site-2 protease family protein [Saprospiraceae bacterium]MCB0682183.1 site-2 protease family protein [Saprospiraceae bacterium]